MIAKSSLLLHHVPHRCLKLCFKSALFTKYSNIRTSHLCRCSFILYNLTIYLRHIFYIILALRIHISQQTYSKLLNWEKYFMEYRGEVEMKVKTEILNVTKALSTRCNLVA